jgi:hypothetical protein
LSALPFRPVTAGVLLPAALLLNWKTGRCAMPGARKDPGPEDPVFHVKIKT